MRPRKGSGLGLLPRLPATWTAKKSKVMATLLGSFKGGTGAYKGCYLDLKIMAPISQNREYKAVKPQNNGP